MMGQGTVSCRGSLHSSSAPASASPVARTFSPPGGYHYRASPGSSPLPVVLPVACDVAPLERQGHSPVSLQPGSRTSTRPGKLNSSGSETWRFRSQPAQPRSFGSARGRRLASWQVRAQSGGASTSGSLAESSAAAGPLDAVFLGLFRRAMAREVGWDSPLPGFPGLVEVAHRLMAKHPDRADTEEATVRILSSLFPAWLLPLFRKLVAPLGGGRPAAILTAFVTQATCQWLMGPCRVNEVQLADGAVQLSGVLVEKCKYLEETKCSGVCIHTCKMPTQTFIKEGMGIPLVMEPNFEDLSCQFKFGVEPPPRASDEALHAPCLSICPAATAAGRAPLPTHSQTPSSTSPPTTSTADSATITTATTPAKGSFTATPTAATQTPSPAKSVPLDVLCPQVIK